MAADSFWEDAAQQDPLWAILSDPTKRGRQWDLRSFFETGHREISLLLYQLKQLGRYPRTARALDFGCGVGRLTQALATAFDEVVGVDISPTMIQLANDLNRHGRRVRYELNETDSLDRFPAGSFDFVYSDIVLQHLDPAAAQRYVAEFLRVLSPGGITVFQLPSHRRTASEQGRRPVNMPANAYRAALAIVEGLPYSLHPGQGAVIITDVRNDSPMSWDQGAVGAIRLGNHWRNPHGDMLLQDDGRTSLPAVVASGKTLRLALSVQAPREHGEFICEIDLVHEGITWFGDMASPTARMPVSVTRTATRTLESEPREGVNRPAIPLRYPDIYATLPPHHAAAESMTFPMHGVPRERVLDLIARNRGEAFFIEEDERGGPEWRGYRYYVVKE